MRYSDDLIEEIRMKNDIALYKKYELTELKEKDACCPKDKKMEVEENKK